VLGFFGSVQEVSVLQSKSSERGESMNTLEECEKKYCELRQMLVAGGITTVVNNQERASK
jgi:hypothetical protein